MNKEKLLEEIEKLKKYSILKSNRHKIDSIIKEEEKLKKEYSIKDESYKKELEANSPLKKEFNMLTEELNSLKTQKIKKIINVKRYLKIKKKLNVIEKELKAKQAIEEHYQLELSLLNKKINDLIGSLTTTCGFEFSKEYYQAFLDEFRDKQYYSIDLIELIKKREIELSKESK